MKHTARHHGGPALALAALLLGGGPAAAADVLTILDQPIRNALRPTGVRFEADEAQGRAWVVVETHEDGDGFSDSPGYDHSENVDIPGLSYDRASGEIRLRRDGREVVCATRGKVLWKTVFREAPGFRLRVHKEARASAADAPRTAELVVELQVPTRQS